MSEFEDKSLPELHAMIAGANPKDFYDRADALSKAASHMDTLSQQLQAHVNSVEWDGESGDAFRSWGQQLVNTTTDFAAYTGNVSQSLYSAGDALTTAVSGIPKPPPVPVVPPPILQPSLTPGLPGSTEFDRQEAINLMTSVSSSYTTAKTDFAAPPPVFRPMPADMVPEGHVGAGQVRLGEGEGAGPESPNAPAASPYEAAGETPRSTVHDDGPDPVRTPNTSGGRTSLDSVPSGPQGDPPHPPPGSVRPSGDTPSGGPGTAGLVPGAGLSPSEGVGTTAGRGSRAGTPDGEGPEPGLSGRGTGSGLPGESGSRGSGAYPGEEGIVGGTTGGRFPSGTPRGGLVVGGEEPAVPRGPGPGGAPGEGGPAGAGEFGSGTSGAGRRAAVEGEAGPACPGVPGGGFGGATGAGAARRRRAGSRPDYVVEDEETWLTDGGTVPPVIDQ
ncbi:WXG100 family type VII secretion target [Streptantibioticus silvisoli]|uniref:WXG100 family type VII secretion target n=1 Tax=Streptantibioticus silvisoli TaxID=2705255 RepID=A0ABT6W3L8_9ACTN|nr:WXG100 family type VII secretion target [Streptantibioticus silvisoli]MDI5965336.1 WXG100 family type VII secretion target [Streptantibioticus silvisoli]